MMFFDRKNRKGRITVKQLYSIMEQLLELDYKQETFLLVLKALETAYSEEKEASSKMLVSHTKWQVEVQNKDLKQQIRQLDTYLSQKE